MPTRRTVSLLTITQPEQSGGTGQARSLSRDSAGLRQEHLTLAILYWLRRKAPPLAAKPRGKVKNEPVQSYTV